MNGQMLSVEPMAVFLPDVQGKVAVEKVSTILRNGRTELITAAGHYLDNLHVGGLSSGNVEVGLKPAMASATNGIGFLDGDHSEPAKLIKDTVAHMKAITEPVIQKVEAISQTRIVGGPSDEVSSQIEARLQQMLAEGDVSRAKQIAQEIERLISTETNQIKGDAGMMEEESLRVEKGLDEEKGAFDQKSKLLGDGYRLYKTSLEWQRTALHRVEEAAIKKGEPLRQKCHQVVGEVSGVEEVWRQFTAQFFKTSEN